jgi:hypothetical protein
MMIILLKQQSCPPCHKTCFQAADREPQKYPGALAKKCKSELKPGRKPLPYEENTVFKKSRIPGKRIIQGEMWVKFWPDSAIAEVCRQKNTGLALQSQNMDNLSAGSLGMVLLQTQG